MNTTDSTVILPSTISRDELVAALAAPRPPVLLEALPETYWRSGHLPGALALPPAELGARIRGLVPDRTTPVVVYCASATCPNSHQVAERLAHLGYQHVRVYVGGKADWSEAGLPLEA